MYTKLLSTNLPSYLTKNLQPKKTDKVGVYTILNTGQRRCIQLKLFKLSADPTQESNLDLSPWT